MPKKFKNKYERTFTIRTRLKGKENLEAIQYFQEFSSIFNSIFRHFWQKFKNTGFILWDIESKVNTELQQEFGISRRTATSIIKSVLGRYNALVELKNYELNQMKGKLNKFIKKYEKLQEIVNKKKVLASENKLTEYQLKSYRRNKRKLYKLSQKIQKLKDRISSLELKIENNDFSICFGTKKLFKSQYNLEENGYHSHEEWLKEYRKKRDANIIYIGSSGEKFSNQMFQLKPNEENLNEYLFKVRKNTKEKQYVFGKCRFSYQNEELRKFLENNKIHGITYQIHFENNRCYLYAMITLQKLKETILTRKSYGTIGLDFNQGFIELAETDKSGNLVYQETFLLKQHRKGSSNQAKSELELQISKIVKYALLKGKDIVIENLDFSKKKSQTSKSDTDFGKEYNKMIHNLDYSRYTKLLENSTFRNNVNLIKVSPYYTSQIPKKKYCPRMKLSVHQGAAFVIARKGQNRKFFEKDLEVMDLEKKDKKKVA